MQIKTALLKKALFYVFTGPQSQGNPAFVIMVDDLPNLDTHIKNIESNHTKVVTTCVYIRPLEKNKFAIRWFNGTSSIQRCGHGTVAAAAFVELNATNKRDGQQYDFISALDVITVQVKKPLYSITLPIIMTEPVKNSAPLSTALTESCRIAQTKNQDGYIIIELKTESSVKRFIVNKTITHLIKRRALIVTAKSHLPSHDIVFRYFAPQHGQVEDIATGSAACVLWPFWEQKNTPKNQPLRCLQLSKQGGEMQVTQTDNNNITVAGTVKVSLSNEC